MRIRCIKTIDTPYRFVAEGTEFDLADDEAKALIASGDAAPVQVKAERAVKGESADKAVKK